MTRAESIIFPGDSAWELWKFPAKSLPVCERNPSPKAIASAPAPLLALPSRTVMAVPLWVSAGGDPNELAELELSGRHLVRRDAEVRTVPVESSNGRSLLLALAIADDPSALPFVSKAKSFDLPARLIDPGSADVAIWRESGSLCCGFYRKGTCVAFSATGEASPGPAFCGVLSRLALRLRAEEVIQGIPAQIRLIGEFSAADRDALAGTLRAEVELISPAPPPRLPGSAIDAAPPAARIARERHASIKKFASLGAIAAAAYVLVLLVLGGDMALRISRLNRLKSEVAAAAPASLEAQNLVSEWREFQGAVNPRHFALDQLAATAAELPGDQVRLTQFTLEGGRLILAGEAADISQAYQFLESVKKSPVLADYEWTSRQPQLAGKNKVRFEMEGARPDAQTRNE